jgi:hypothetical protein
MEKWRIYMAILENNQQKNFNESLEQRLFEEKVILLEVPHRGMIRFEFGVREESGGFPYYVKIEIENSQSEGHEFIAFGGVDSRNPNGVVNSLIAEWPHFNRNLFEQALAERK